MIFFDIVVNTMLPLFFLVGVGYFLDKKFHMDIKTMSKLIFFLIVPSFLFTNIYTTQFPSTSLHIVGSLLLFMALSFLLATLVGKIRHYDQGMMASCRNALMFNNTGNLGVAVILLIFSHSPFVVDGQTPYLQEALTVQIIFFVSQSILLNTLGLYQGARGHYTPCDALKVILHMPIVYAFLAALLCRWGSIDAKSFFLWPVLEMSGKCLLPVAMVSIGAQLSQTKIQLFNREVEIVCGMKLFVMPLVGLTMIFLANHFLPGLFTPISALVFLIYCTIPTAVNTSLYAIEFDNHPDYATQCVLNTTVLSCISITVFTVLGKYLLL
jgi:malate permease and related proteins